MPTHITLETFMNLKRKGFQQIAMYRDNTTANIGFSASGAEGITIGICSLFIFGSGRRISI